MFFKKTALLLTSLCFSFLLSTQANAGGVFYSNEGDTVMIPNDTEVVILLKKGTEITAVDSHGKAMPSCPSCTSTTGINPVKMLVTLNQDGSLGVIDTQAKAKAKPKAKPRSSSAPVSMATFAAAAAEDLKFSNSRLEMVLAIDNKGNTQVFRHRESKAIIPPGFSLNTNQTVMMKNITDSCPPGFEEYRWRDEDGFDRFMCIPLPA